MTYSVSPIGFVRSCFKEKFAIPRQPQLAPAARGVLELVAPFNQGDAVQGLEQVSHVWLLFVFHQALEDKPRLKVRPPRLGGNTSMGVFATRATHRPNGIGQSVVKLDKVEPGRLFISGIDLLDGTPLLDNKPYVPYAAIIDSASNSMASAPHLDPRALERERAAPGARPCPAHSRAAGGADRAMPGPRPTAGLPNTFSRARIRSSFLGCRCALALPGTRSNSRA